MIATILIPVKDADFFILDALKSCMNQVTSFQYKVLVVDDHSSDNTQKYLEDFSRAYDNFSYLVSPGYGISEALNYGLAMSSTKYICRMDADDVMMPNRIQSQLTFLEKNEHCLAVGGQIEILNSTNQYTNANLYPMGDQLELFMAKGCYLAHPTVTFRTEAVKAIGGYRHRFDGAEDYDLWLRLSYFGSLDNLPQTVLQYRVHQNQVTARFRFRTLIATSLVRLSWIFGRTQKNLRKIGFQKNQSHFTVSQKKMLRAFISDIARHFKAYLTK